MLIAMEQQAQFSVPRLIQGHETLRQGDIDSGDLDDDGDMDLLYISGEDGQVGWWENDGNGSYPTKHQIGVLGTWAIEAFLCDLDGDGDLDVLLSAHQTTAIAWAEGLGGGQFAPIIPMTEPGTSLFYIAVGDLNENGAADFVGYQMQEGGFLDIAWYEFTPTGQLVTHAPVHTGIDQAPKLRILDMNGDGHSDIVAFTGDDPLTYWFAGDGNGNFGSAQSLLDPPIFLNDAISADFDADGDVDLISVHPDTSDLSPSLDKVIGLMENVSGAFQPPVPIDTIDAYSNSCYLATADMDEDGDLDVAGCCDRSIFWMRNDNGSFSDVITVSDLQLSPGPLHLVDADGDEDLDIITRSHSESLLCWYENLGGGQFDHLRIIGRGLYQVVDMYMTDVDGNGRNDLLVASRQDSRVAWFPDDPFKLFGNYHLIDSEATAVSALVPTDDDGDGDVDVLAVLPNADAVVRYGNTSAGYFAARTAIGGSAPYPNFLRAADLDEDGDDDLIYGGYMNDSLFWIERSGPGTYGNLHILNNTESLMDAASADLDMDGTVDILAALGNPANKVIWYRGLGGGGFAPAQDIISLSFYPMFVRVADLDGDGDPDVLATDPDWGLAWYANDGSGAFPSSFTIDPGSENVNLAECADLDLDGDLDVLATFDDNRIAWYPNDGAGGFTQVRDLVVSDYGLQRAMPLDVDADGDLDIVFSNSFSGTLKYMENFILGGCTVHGTVYADLDQDAVRDPDEPGVPQAQIVSDPPASAPLTDANGDYTFYMPQGDYTISVGNLPAYWGLTTDSVQFLVQLTTGTPAVANIDFGYVPILDTTILALSIDPAQAPCGESTAHHLSVTNLGTSRPSMVVSYTFDTLFQFVGSTPPTDSLVGYTGYWHVDDLSWFQPALITCGLISPLADSVALDPEAMNTLSAMVLDSLGMGVGTIETTLPLYLGCAYDPNDKHVDPQGYGDAGAILLSTAELTYRIRFQNTGTATAQNVMIRDRISEHLDPSTLHLIGWSHVPSAMLIENDGELVVSFDNIQLPDSSSDFLGSMGYITYRVAVRPGAAHATEILNEAEIYFDNEEGVTTNTTTSTLIDCDLWSPSIAEPFAGVLRATPGDSYQWFLDGVPLVDADQQDLAVAGTGFFTVVVTSMFGCVATSEPYQVISTSSVGMAASGLAISVFPVPFSNTARLVMDRPLSTKHVIDLLDPSGRMVRSWKGNGRNELVLDRSGVANGIYLVRVSDGNGQIAACRVVID